MKRASKLLSLLLVLSMMCGLFVPAMAAEEKAAPQEGKIVILHTNDVHCGVDDNIGYAGLAAYKKAAEAKYGEANVTLIDAGDAIQGGNIGTVSKGSYIVDIMNQVGYDFAVPGNHEFDYGMENFLTLAKEKAEYTYLCCNFIDLKSNKPVFDAFETVTYGDTKVAYVGIDTPEAFTKSTPTYFQDAKGNYIYGFAEGNKGKDLYTAVQAAVDAAKKDGANYVVAIGHLGENGSADEWKSSAVIANTTGIDVFIDGHSHEETEKAVTNKDGKDVKLAQTGTKLANIGQIVIDPVAGTIDCTLVKPEEGAAPDADMAAFIAGINEQFETEMAKVVATSEVDLTTLDSEGNRLVRSGETNLGDLCADAYRVVMGADVGLMNGGGIRADIVKGEVTMGDILNVYTFGNEACLAEVTGQQLMDALEFGARNYPEENGGFLQVSGLTYTIDTAVTPSITTNDKKEFISVDGAYRVKDVTIDGKPLDLEKTYTVGGHNYMLKNGGDGYTMFGKNITILKDSVMVDNAALVSYITGELKGTITAAQYGVSAGRITILKDALADFADLKDGAWYNDAVRYVVENGTMHGIGKAAFSPAGTVTRATVYQTLYNLEGKPAPAEDDPTLAMDKAWYNDAMNWAYAKGLYRDATHFTQDTVITRAEIAVIIADYAALKGITVDTAGMAMKEAPDYESIPADALEGMTFCFYAGVMTGDQKGNLNPDGQLTRAEFAQVLMNFDQIPEAADKAA